MRARILPVLACLAFASLSDAAPPVLEIVRDGRGRTLAVKNTAARAPQQTFFASLLASPTAEPAPEAMMARAGAVLAPLAAHFGVASADLHPQGARMDALRMQHVHYVQRHHGVPVYGSEVLVHANPDGELSTINGRTLPIAEGSVETVPGIDADAAVAAAKAWAGQAAQAAAATPAVPACCGGSIDDAAAKGLLEPLKPPKLWLYNEAFLTNQSSATPTHLVWEIVLGEPGGKTSDTFYIDAIDSSLVKRSSNAQRLNRKIWECTNHKTDGVCRMDSFSSDYNYTFGRSEGRPARGPNPVPGPAYGSTDVDKMYDLVPVIESYYLSKFGRNGGNDHGGIGNGSTSYPYATTTIFADINASTLVTSGHFKCPDAFNNFGESIGFCAFTVGDDTFGHEYAHTVAWSKSFSTDGTPNSLLDLGESGALNESNSDIMGEAFEFYRTGSADWIFGTGTNVYGGRSLADPPIASNGPFHPYPFPDRYHHPDFYRGSALSYTDYDAGGVHTNCSVPDKAAYLTAMGGTFNGYTITGLGPAKVEQIWYRALTTYYANSETFNGAYFALRQAAADLYPPADVDELTKALQAVEMDQPPLPAPPFVITTVTRPAPAFTAAVTWNSHAGKTYGVQYSTDLVTWTDLNAYFPAQGERTTYTDTTIAPTTSTLFYRVEQK